MIDVNEKVLKQVKEFWANEAIGLYKIVNNMVVKKGIKTISLPVVINGVIDTIIYSVAEKRFTHFVIIVGVGDFVQGVTPGTGYYKRTKEVVIPIGTSDFNIHDWLSPVLHGNNKDVYDEDGNHILGIGLDEELKYYCGSKDIKSKIRAFIVDAINEKLAKDLKK